MKWPADKLSESGAETNKTVSHHGLFKPSISIEMVGVYSCRSAGMTFVAVDPRPQPVTIVLMVRYGARKAWGQKSQPNCNRFP